MATTRKSLKQVISDLEERGSLNKQDADSLRVAPKWSLTIAEITAYFGGCIIAVGIAWVSIALAQNFDRSAVTLALYLVGALALTAAKWLQPRNIRSGQVAEALFGLSVGSLAGALGITLNNLGLRGSVATAIVSILAIILGLATCRRTSFVGTLIIVAAAQSLIISTIAAFNFSETAHPLIIIFSGALLVWLGLQEIGVALFARFAGAISIVTGSLSFALAGDNIIRSVVSLAICAALFYKGARRINLEFIVGGGTGTTFAIGIFTGKLFDSVVVQGITVTATGVTISALAFVIVRRSERGSS